MELEPAELRRQREEFEAAKRRIADTHPIPEVKVVSSDEQAKLALGFVRGERQKVDNAVAQIVARYRREQGSTTEEQSQ